jgi:hypothetical protein
MHKEMAATVELQAECDEGCKPSSLYDYEAVQLCHKWSVSDTRSQIRTKGRKLGQERRRVWCASIKRQPRSCSLLHSLPPHHRLPASGG